MDINDKIYIAGHKGMVGSAILNALTIQGFKNIITRSHKELNLIDTNNVESFFTQESPQYVFVCAAKVGGIFANNKYRAQFLYENLMIQNNLIHTSYKYKIKKLLFLGSACIYPKDINRSIKEEDLLSGKLEKTNEPYAIAKIAGIKLCENYFRQYNSNFISIMPNNLYGPNDNFDLETSHVLPALIRKFFEAKKFKKNYVEIWGTGKPLREFLHVTDLANASIFFMKSVNAKDLYNNGISHINIGTGNEISIEDLAIVIKNVSKYNGKIKFNNNYPDGVKRKLLDIARLKKLGWSHNIDLNDGIKSTYQWFVNNYNF